MRRVRTHSIAVLSGWCLAVVSPAHALDWEPIVYAGDAAVGLPGEPPLISADPVRWLGDGSLIYGGAAQVEAGGVGVWQWTPPATTGLLAAFLPGEPSGLGEQIWVAANGAGDLALVDQRPSPSRFPHRTVYGPNGSGGVTPLIATGDPMPGTSGSLEFGVPVLGTSASSGPLAIMESRWLAFGAIATADVDLPGDDFAALLTADPSGALALVALQGDQAPSAPVGFRFESFNWSAQALNEAGQLAFRAHLASGAEQADAIYRWDPAGGMELIALHVADASPQNVAVDAAPVDPPIIDPQGGVAFLAGGLYVPDGTGGIERIVADGDALPGLPPAVFERPFFQNGAPQNLLLANDGAELAVHYGYERVPFEPPYGDGSVLLVWSRAAGLRERVRSDSPGDGAPVGSLASFSVLAFGEGGEVALRATRNGASTTTAILVSPAAGALRTILADSDPFPTSEGGTVTTDPLAAAIAFDADFANVSVSRSDEGLYVATVPEPSTGLGAATALAALLAVRRRGRAG